MFINMFNRMGILTRRDSVILFKHPGKVLEGAVAEEHGNLGSVHPTAADKLFGAI